ncbi:MAG: hypothetical protein WDN29_08645 [Methylovirgula sp.]
MAETCDLAIPHNHRHSPRWQRQIASSSTSRHPRVYIEQKRIQSANLFVKPLSCGPPLIDKRVVALVQLHIELKPPAWITPGEINMASRRDLPSDIEKAIATLNKLEFGEFRSALRSLDRQSAELSELSVASSQGLEVGTGIFGRGGFVRNACKYQCMKRAARIFDVVRTPEVVGRFSKERPTSMARFPDAAPNECADDEDDQEESHSQYEGLVFSNPSAGRVPCTRCTDCVDQGEEAECYCEGKSWYFIPSHASGLNGIRGRYQGTKN